MLPVAGPESLCRCCPHYHASRQQLTFRWTQAFGGHKVSEPLPTEVMASDLYAVVIQSQANKSAPVSRAPEPGSELPASNSDSAAQDSAPVIDSAAQESAPVTDVSHYVLLPMIRILWVSH